MTEIKNYQFVHDPEQIRLFYDEIIAPHTEHPTRSFILIPVARRKYWGELSKGQITICTRTIYTHKLTFTKFLNTLLRYQVVEGLYTDQDRPIPAEAFGFYLTCDPMNERSTMFELINAFNKRIDTYLKSDRPDYVFDFNVNREYKSTLHRNPIKSVAKFDVDTKDEELIAKLDHFLEEQQIPVKFKVETHNGYHYLIKKEDQNQALHKFAMKNKEWISIENNALIIIPGTYQGGFATRIVAINEKSLI